MTALPYPDREERAREALLAPWRDRPLEELVRHLEVRYHRKLERDLRRLVLLAEECRTRRVHGDLTTLLDVQRTLLTLSDELLDHMAKEENILFPWILGGNRRTAGAPIAVMQHDHRRTGELQERLRVLTQGFRPPPGGCTTWCRLVLGLRDLSTDLDEHMLLEDHVLFPRALGGA